MGLSFFSLVSPNKILNFIYSSIQIKENEEIIVYLAAFNRLNTEICIFFRKVLQIIRKHNV